MWFLISLSSYPHHNPHVTEHTTHVLLLLLYPLPQMFLVDLQSPQPLNLEINIECMVGAANGGGVLSCLVHS